ncbi:PepSY domain-containing protein [Streptomyces sp. SPB78]|uniref:PepSY domain-containing protein n=1 Tax=Streptomyces sp. (strain SPB78) TaxID=591157 RepID=UPI001F403496|nr:PepSY domain-containing protein [Streptomyces sp. SPB78]
MRRTSSVLGAVTVVVLAGGTLVGCGDGGSSDGGGSASRTSAGANAATTSPASAAATSPASTSASPSSGASATLPPKKGTGSDADEHRAEAKAAAMLPAPEAIGKALAHTPGKVLSAEIDDNAQDRLIWEFEILAKDGTLQAVDVNPAGGAILSSHQERGESDDLARGKRLLKGGTTDAAAAAKAAAAKGTVVSVKLKPENGGHWSVETGPGDRDWSVPLDSVKVSPERHD